MGSHVSQAIHVAAGLGKRIVGAPNEDPRTKFSDLNMLVAPGGRERTIEEWPALLEPAGFELVGTTPTASRLAVLDARPS